MPEATIRGRLCNCIPGIMWDMQWGVITWTCLWHLLAQHFSYTLKFLIWDAPNLKTQMSLVSSCSCLCPIYWSHASSWEWRCSWSSTDRPCSDYISVINNLIAHKGATYIRDLTVYGIGELWSGYDSNIMIISSTACTQSKQMLQALKDIFFCWSWLTLRNISIWCDTCMCQQTMPQS